MAIFIILAKSSLDTWDYLSVNHSQGNAVIISLACFCLWLDLGCHHFTGSLLRAFKTFYFYFTRRVPLRLKIYFSRETWPSLLHSTLHSMQYTSSESLLHSTLHTVLFQAHAQSSDSHLNDSWKETPHRSGQSAKFQTPGSPKAEMISLMWATIFVIFGQGVQGQPIYRSVGSYNKSKVTCSWPVGWQEIISTLDRKSTRLNSSHL